MLWTILIAYCVLYVLGYLGVCVWHNRFGKRPSEKAVIAGWLALAPPLALAMFIQTMVVLMHDRGCDQGRIVRHRSSRAVRRAQEREEIARLALLEAQHRKEEAEALDARSKALGMGGDDGAGRRW